MDAFDFAGFKHAFTTRDARAWAAYYAEDAQWIEYRRANPPRAPFITFGAREIAEFIGRIAAGKLSLAIEDVVLGPERAAFRVWCTLADSRRIVEHVIICHAQGRITRRVDVEAWD
jgi:hypothetical protein